MNVTSCPNIIEQFKQCRKAGNKLFYFLRSVCFSFKEPGHCNGFVYNKEEMFLSCSHVKAFFVA